MPARLVTDDDLRAYAFQPHLSTASQATYLRFCRMLFKWLAAEGIVPADVAAGIRYPKRSDKVSLKLITEAQLGDLLDAHAAAETSTISRGWHGWFSPAAATFFYAGLRAREAAELTWKRVDLDRGHIIISASKSGRERIIPMRTPLRPYLDAWHAEAGRPTSGLVFPKRRRAAGDIPLSTDNISKTFKAYARAAKLPETVTLHGLRHSCATELLRRGMSSFEVMKVLGHASVATTQIYEHLDAGDLHASMQRLGL